MIDQNVKKSQKLALSLSPSRAKETDEMCDGRKMTIPYSMDGTKKTMKKKENIARGFFVSNQHLGCEASQSIDIKMNKMKSNKINTKSLEVRHKTHFAEAASQRLRGEGDEFCRFFIHLFKAHRANHFN